MQVLIFILALNGVLRKSSQGRDRRFHYFHYFAHMERSTRCMGMMHPDVHGGTFLLLSQRRAPMPGVSEGDGDQQRPKMPACNPRRQSHSQETALCSTLQHFVFFMAGGFYKNMPFLSALQQEEEGCL